MKLLHIALQGNRNDRITNVCQLIRRLVKWKTYRLPQPIIKRVNRIIQNLR